MNGNKTLKDLENQGCAYGIASRAVQEERDSNMEKRIDNMEGWIGRKLDKIDSRIMKIWVTAIPNILTFLGIIITIILIITSIGK